MTHKDVYSEFRSEISRKMAEDTDAKMTSFDGMSLKNGDTLTIEQDVVIGDGGEVPLPTLLMQDVKVATLLHLLFDATKAQRIGVTRDGETFWLRVKRSWDGGWQLQIGKTEETTGVRRPIEIAEHGPDHEVWPDDEPDTGLHVSFTEE